MCNHSHQGLDFLDNTHSDVQPKHGFSVWPKSQTLPSLALKEGDEFAHGTTDTSGGVVPLGDD